MDNQIVDLVKGVPNILGQVYSDLAQPSVMALGKALGTVFEFSTSFLLPIKLLNEKFKANFEKRLNEYKTKLEQIPEEKRCEVHPQIGTPIIDKLSYTTNDEIADLFTTLLANASNIDMMHTAHPSFVNMIERLSPDEARIVRYLKDKNDIQYCDFRGNFDSGGYITLREHLTLISKEINLAFPENINAYLANLVSIGILCDKNGQYRTDQTIYNKIKEQYGFKDYEAKLVPAPFHDIETHKSYFQVTDFGRLFIQACAR